MDDVHRYRDALAAVAERSTDLTWADSRPWSVKTHIGWEGQLPVVDLHDLSARLARDTVRELVARPPEAGAVVFIHGRGRHTIGPTSVLSKVVHKELRRACGANVEWSYRLMGPGRTVWISDRGRAPAAATGRLGWGCWLLGLLFVAAALAPLLFS